MAELGGMMLQLGAVLLVAFLGATVASRFRVSLIVGYIVAGVLIGPFMVVDLGGFARIAGSLASEGWRPRP